MSICVCHPVHQLAVAPAGDSTASYGPAPGMDFDARELNDHGLDRTLTRLAPDVHVDVSYAKEGRAPPHDAVGRTLGYVFLRLKEAGLLHVQRVPYTVAHAILDRLPEGVYEEYEPLFEF